MAPNAATVRWRKCPDHANPGAWITVGCSYPTAVHSSSTRSKSTQPCISFGGPPLPAWLELLPQVSACDATHVWLFGGEGAKRLKLADGEADISVPKRGNRLTRCEEGGRRLGRRSGYLEHEAAKHACATRHADGTYTRWPFVSSKCLCRDSHREASLPRVRRAWRRIRPRSRGRCVHASMLHVVPQTPKPPQPSATFARLFNETTRLEQQLPRARLTRSANRIIKRKDWVPSNSCRC